MILNILALLIFIGFFILVIYCGIHIDEDKDLPNTVEDCLAEIEDLSLNAVYQDRIYDLCENVMRLHQSELVLAKRNSERRKAITDDIIKIIEETSWKDVDMLINNIRSMEEWYEYQRL